YSRRLRSNQRERQPLAGTLFSRLQIREAEVQQPALLNSLRSKRGSVGEQDRLVRTLFPGAGDCFKRAGLAIFLQKNSRQSREKELACGLCHVLADGSRFPAHLRQLGTRLQYLIHGIGDPALHTRAAGCGFPARFHCNYGVKVLWNLILRHKPTPCSADGPDQGLISTSATLNYPTTCNVHGTKVLCLPVHGSGIALSTGGIAL